MRQTRLGKAARDLVMVLVILSTFALVACSDDDGNDGECRNVNAMIPLSMDSVVSVLGLPIPFPNGSAFNAGIGNNPATLTFNTASTFTLTSGSATGSGDVVFGSCLLTVTASTFPVGQGPQVGDSLTFPTCQFVIRATAVEVGGDEVTGTAALDLVNAADVSATSSEGSVQVSIREDGILVVNGIPTDIDTDITGATDC